MYGCDTWFLRLREKHGMRDREKGTEEDVGT